MSIAKLQRIWREYHDHIKREPTEDDASRTAREASRASGDIKAFAESLYMTAYTPWNQRRYELLKEIESAYIEAGDEISPRERNLIKAGASTACCCNDKGEGYAWCTATWPEAGPETIHNV